MLRGFFNDAIAHLFFEAIDLPFHLSLFLRLRQCDRGQKNLKKLNSKGVLTSRSSLR